MKTAARSNIPAFMVMEALREANALSLVTDNEQPDVLHLSLGQPSARAPMRVLQKAADMALSDTLGYTDSRGLPELRARIARHYFEQYGANVDADAIFVTVGSSAAYFLALLSAFDAGDRVAMVSPHYAASPNMMQALGIVPVIMPSTLRDNFQPTVAMLEALDEKPDGLVIASPSNPTGTVIDEGEFKRLHDYCVAHNIRIISDEIYHGVTYEGAKVRSAVEFSDRMIVVNSFSKYYLMPGWRLGWAVIPPELRRPMESLLQNFFISPPAISQYAALEGMECRADYDRVVESYAKNRDLLLRELPKAGFINITPSQGAFYLYADVSHLTNDSNDFCRRMLHEARVCAVSGVDFDRDNGHRFVRFSYSGSYADMQRACARLVQWMGKI